MMKLQTKPGKINKHCINCGRDKHNVEMCRVEKKGEPIVATTKATNQPHKGQNNNSYVCHIYGLNGHKMMDYAEMQKMFQGKNASSSEGKAIVEIKTIIANVNVIDVNVAKISKIIEDQVFEEREPRNNKSTTYWEEEKLKKEMVETIQQLQKS